MTNWKAIEASLYQAIDKWVQKQAGEAEGEPNYWIQSYFPPEGTELMTDAAVAVLKGIEASGLFTESETPR